MEDNDFLIPLKDLTPRGSYKWGVLKEFFESFGNAEIVDVPQMDVDVRAERAGACVKVDGWAVGKVISLCDRCGGELELRVDMEFSLLCGTEEALRHARPDSEGPQDEGYFTDGEGTVRFGTPDSREELVLSEGAAGIDLRQTIYDCVCLSLPMKKVHGVGGCDPEVLERLAGFGARTSAAGRETGSTAAGKDSGRETGSTTAGKAAGGKTGRTSGTETSATGQDDNPFAALGKLFKEE